MTRRPDPPEPLRALATDVADGVRAVWPEGADSQPVQDNLLKLQRLSEAFGAAREGIASGQGQPEFHWCHLDVFEALGKGGFGTVYRAFDPMLGREVALKLRHGSSVRDHALMQEARRLARVRHPNVLAVHGADVDDGRAGIWTDLLTGQTLERAIEAGLTFDSARVLELTEALADALAAIHAAGLIHGDIKAANVMLQSDGAPILMDFGAASESADEAQSTGSPLVMAPEALAGADPDPSSDIYSLGVLIYRMATGQYPINAESVEQLKRAHENRVPVNLKRLPSSARPLVARVLSYDPEVRPTATELLDELIQIRDLPEQRRRKLAVSTVIVALVVAAGALAFGLLAAQQSERKALAAQAESEYALEFLGNILSSPKGSEAGAQAKVVDVVDQALREFEFSPPLDAHRRATIARTLASTYFALGNVDNAEMLFQQAQADLLSLPVTDWPKLLALRSDYNQVLLERNELQAAETLLLEAERDLLRHAPEETRTHVRLLLGLAGTYALAEREDEERAVIERAVPIAAKLGKGSDLPAIVRNYQAQANRPINLALAEQQARSARAWIADQGDTNSALVIDINRVLASILIEAGKFEDAQPLVEEALMLSQRQYPAGTRVEVALLDLSGVLLDRTGQSEAAFAATEKALELSEKVFGTEHRQTLSVLANLAVRLQSLGRLEEAEAANREAIARVSAAYSPTHGLALLLRGNLAEVLLLLNKFAEAEREAAAARLVDLDVFGPEHVLTLFATDILGAALSHQGKLEEALKHLENSYQLKLATMGPDNPYTLDTGVLLGEALLRSGQPQRAEPLLAAALQQRTEVFGADHDSTRHVQSLLMNVRQLTEPLYK